MYQKILNQISSARIEFRELDLSVHDSFVVPPYLDTNHLLRESHSIALEGGRGCGKTTYLLYFSHWTQFDKRRESLPDGSLNAVLLYHKPDTVFCRAMNENWLSEQKARDYFYSLTSLELLYELLCAIENISHHFKDLEEDILKNDRFFAALKAISGLEINSLEEGKQWILDGKYAVEASVNRNAETGLPPLEPKAMLDRLLKALRQDSRLLRETRFKVFVDEFENLSPYQQKIINSYRKHSDASLSWNVAHKRFAKISTSTLGDEHLQSPDDYRVMLLDDELKSDQFKLLASEILLLTFYNAGLDIGVSSINPTYLGDTKQLSERRTGKYKADVLSLTDRLFPTPEVKELSEIAFRISSLKTRISKRLSEFDSTCPGFSDLVMTAGAEVAVTTWGVCKQKTFKPESVVEYLKKGKPDNHPFSTKIGTFLYGSLLGMNLQYSSYVEIPVYAGFQRFCYLANGNLRHFFELCYQSIKQASHQNDMSFDSLKDFPPLEYAHAHRGAKTTSSNVVKEVHNFAPYGQTLSALVNRLGDLFQIMQRNEAQSEPEKNHFFIEAEYGQLPSELQDIIDQAKCWRVLIQFAKTKDKKPSGSSMSEYQLNPIYAPHFSISYRKKRRVEFTEDAISIIVFGDAKQYENLRKEIEGKFGSRGSGSQASQIQLDL